MESVGNRKWVYAGNVKRFLPSLPMTSGQVRFLALLPMTSGRVRFLASLGMTGVSREKGGRLGGGKAAA